MLSLPDRIACAFLVGLWAGVVVPELIRRAFAREIRTRIPRDEATPLHETPHLEIVHDSFSSRRALADGHPAGAPAPPHAPQARWNAALPVPDLPASAGLAAGEDVSCPSCDHRLRDWVLLHQEEHPQTPRRYHETLASLAGDPDARLEVAAQEREAFFDNGGLALEAEEADRD